MSVGILSIFLLALNNCLFFLPVCFAILVGVVTEKAVEPTIAVVEATWVALVGLKVILKYLSLKGHDLTFCLRVFFFFFFLGIIIFIKINLFFKG
jgi:hypothetical protein